MINTTIITPTIGTDFLRDAVLSVRRQTQPVNHLIVVDGAEYYDKVLRLIDPHPNQKILVLPENVGGGGWYGHRIYASIPMLVNTKYVAFLDEDNMITSDFAGVMEQCMRPEIDVLTCRRIVVRQDATLIGRDNVESVGHSDLGYYLHDTNTYLFRQTVAPKICPAIYGQWGADRNFSAAVFHHGKHTHLSQYFGSIYRSPVNLYQHFEGICTK